MRIAVFGDVHGCIDEFSEMLDILEFEGFDKIVSLGDLVDRGPDSPGCVFLWKEISEKYPGIMILGNHDDKCLRFASHTKRFLSEGKKIRMNTDKVKPWQKKVTDDGHEISWLPESEEGREILSILRDSVLFHEIGDYSFVHGGLPPRLKSIPSKRKYQKEFMYCRYISKEKNTPVSFDDIDRIPHYFWADKYDGRFGTICFGHQPHEKDEVFSREHSIALDTGCVFGGHLSAVIIDTESNSTDLFQVAAKKQYAERRR